MGWKCVPQVLGLVRGEPKPGQKNRANGLKIAKEAGDERAGKSATMDRNRKHLNVYEGYDRGEEFWEDMEEEAESYVVRKRVKNKKTGEVEIKESSLRSDAVLGFAIVYKPPSEICMYWSDEDYDKFYRDCEECMAEICPEIFRPENIRMRAEHHDEGILPEGWEGRQDAVRHLHDLGICKNTDGLYCGNLIDAKLRITINKRFPSMMRERGWDMEDLDVTDWDKAKTDNEYAKERNAKRRKNGRSVNAYITQKLSDKAREMDTMIDEAEDLVLDAFRQKRDAETEGDSIRRRAENDAKLTEAVAAIDARRITERAKEDADEILMEATERAQEISIDAQIEAHYVKQDRMKEAEKEIEKQQEKMRLADEAKRKKDEEDRQARLRVLIAKAGEVHRACGYGEGLDPGEADEQKIIDAVLDDFQHKEDALEAQERAMKQSQAQAETEKRAYETARKSYEEEVESIREEKQGVWGIVTDFLSMLQANPPNEVVRRSVMFVSDVLKDGAKKWNEKYTEWRKKKLEQRRSRIDDIESDLQESLRNGREYE